jgi:hypothetical protein
MTTATRPLARPLDTAAHINGAPTRAVCATDPAKWDFDRSTAPLQVAAAEMACRSCPLLRRCAALLVILPDELLPKGTVMAGQAISWYQPLVRDALWRKRLARMVARYAQT